MRLLGVRLLAQSAICAVRPTRCVLAMETVVDLIHAATMGAVAVGSHDDGHCRAAAANVASASAFAAADLVAVRRHRQLSDASGNPVLRWRDTVADRLCRLLPRWASLREKRRGRGLTVDVRRDRSRLAEYRG
ncbi:hypothetical protein ORI20_05535 [Mycobacterium sp. CVI_P3]|uniref:Secreted protein n=1 Tax=Mycobacterium pinniadriaticum TaxID=2994102 RepID=A0ABT3SAK4_9MYCO|nr:hypothetical protein [Mycobacterium pinniadriaticum]MCX2929724.1 hypothetical protein [Mycobacterium pinniadriaticum]MCX2936148.1 hypothetical protein [Mycobacterium pinniadriaticum]